MLKLLAVACVVGLALGDHSYVYNIKGRFLCGDAPLSGIRVKLVEKDMGIDDEFGEVTTGTDGRWEIRGRSTQSGMEAMNKNSLDLMLKVYHRCLNVAPDPSKRRTDFFPPNQHLDSPDMLDLGTINLETWLDSSEETDWI